MHKLGINYTAGKLGTLQETMDEYAHLGFDAVFTGYDALAENGEYAEAIAKAGLWYECIHAPFDRINEIWREGETGEDVTRELIANIECCRRFSIPYVVVHLSAGNNAPCVNDLGHARFDRVVEAAVKNGVTVCFENQRKLANIAFAFEIYDKIDQVRFCWDIGHEMCFTAGRQYMPLFGKKLVYTHIHDNLCEQEGDLHMLPFDGRIDFAARAKLLREYGYQGTLTLEVIPGHGGLYLDADMHEYYQKAYNAVRRIRDMVENG